MSKALLTLRVLAALPLLGIGLQHLTGAAPMLPILEGAGLPFPEIGAVVAPLAEVLAGLSLLLGLFPRLGALMAAGSMVGALIAHARFDWADEPPLFLPIAILAVSLLIALQGAGILAVHPSPKPVAA